VSYATRGEPGERDGVTLVSYGESVKDCGAVILAIPGPALKETLSQHADLLNGRLLIDPTNVIETETFHQLPLFATYVPRARVARAWSSLGGMAMQSPEINGTRSDLVWCGVDGADGAAGDFGNSLIADSGLRPVRVGGLEAVGIVEAATRLVLGLIFGAGWPHGTGLQLLRPEN
jgi:predicted dinucleotide-binding enzyme